MRAHHGSGRWLLLLVPLLFLTLFYFYPLIKIILLSFSPRPELGQGDIRSLVDNIPHGFSRILAFTFWQAALSTLLTLVFALPGAYIFAHFTFAGKKILQTLMTIPFVLPTVVTAAAFRALLGHGGLVNQGLMALFQLKQPPINIEQSVLFFLMAHVFYNYSLVLRVVAGYWHQLDSNLHEAATMLGASPWLLFRKITLPLLLPAIGSSALLVFIFCFTSFGVVLILGGPTCATLEVEIYRQAVQLFHLPRAAFLSLVQISINFLLMWLYSALSGANRVSFFSASGLGVSRRPGSLFSRWAVRINIGFMTLLLFSPLAALVIRSFMGEQGFTLAYYQALFTADTTSVFYVPPINAVLNSLGFALAATLIATAVGLPAAIYLAGGKEGNSWGDSFWDAVIMLPLATSAVTLGFGYIISLNAPPINLRDSLLIVPLAHALIAFSFVVRCTLPGLRRIPTVLRDAARILGCSTPAVWRHIDIPLISRAVIIGALFSFSISMGEFGASAFVTRPHTPTMPVAIFRFLGQPGDMNYGQAMAMSTILMLVTAAGFQLIGKLEER